MIGTVYDYYLSTYAGKHVNKYDTHKKSELRSVYNNIVKISKSSPLYKVDVSEDIQKYAIDLKENARSIKEAAGNLFTDTMLTNSKVYGSSDDSVLSASIIDSISEDDFTESAASQSKESKALESPTEEPQASYSKVNNSSMIDNSYTFEVKNLASPQINTSKYLDSYLLDISRGEHYFEASLGKYTYEFQFNVTKDDNNKSVMEKISRLINKSNTGINSSVLNSGDKTALEIRSEATGLGFNPEIFTISGSTEHPKDSIVSDYGLDNISSYPSNALFNLNGMEKTSSSNTFTINNKIQVNLNGINKDGDSTTISLKDNVDSVLDSINSLVDNFNKFIILAKDKSKDGGDASHLYKEFNRYSNICKEDLETVGLTFDTDGQLQFDDSLIIQAAKENSLTESLSKLNNFKSGLIAKSEDISINPMKYVNKTMISYPNPVKGFANPYVTSIYSGMMFNGYT